MAINKYKLIRGKEVNISPYIYKAVENNKISCDIIISKESKRLDHYAHEYYGDSRLWWVIAWYNKTPTESHVSLGSVLSIPNPISKVLKYMRNK